MTFVHRFPPSVVMLAGLVLVSACSAPVADDDAAESMAALETGYVGDRGGLREEGEVDPTRLPGFRSGLERTSEEAPARVVLDFTWFGQPNGFWCGPGSVRMALSTRMETPPAQPVLADFMGTTREGTARADTVRALNQWLAPKVPYVSIPVDMRPTPEQRDLLKKTVISRLSSGWPVVANVLSGWRPPGYPGGTIGHFVAVVGYDDHGDKIMIADPAGAGSAGPKWEDVPKTYWISFQNFGTWVGGRGYSGDPVPEPPPAPPPSR
jgi:hypothetical protein